MNSEVSYEPFSGGERRQLFARDLRMNTEAPLVRIEQGEALELREDCRAGHLICPFPGCPDPRYTTSGGQRRDHFRHLHRAPHLEHSPEAWFRFVGTRLIADWLKELGAEVEVRLGPRSPNDPNPDVRARFADGRLVVFEVQYAALTPEDWQRRQDDYSAQGAVAYWLFGHLPRHFRRVRSTYVQGLYRLTPVQLEIEKAGRRVRWIAPNDGLIGTRQIETAPLPWNDDWTAVAFDDLAEMQLDGTTVLTPTDLREREAALALRARSQRTHWEELRERRLRSDKRHATAAKLAEHRARIAAARELSPAVRQVALDERQTARTRSQGMGCSSEPTARRVALPASFPPPRALELDERRALVQDVLLEPFRGEWLAIPDAVKLVRAAGVSVGDFVSEVFLLEKEGLIQTSKPFSMTGGRVRILGGVSTHG